MRTRDVTLACITDYGGRVRGKGYPTDDAASFARKGIGLAPTNLMITTFGDIVDSPWGSRGELLMMPDPTTETVIDLGLEKAAERFILCNLDKLDGSPWEGCPRHWLRRGCEALEAEFGLRPFAAFEHEFHYSGVSEDGGNAYGLEAFRQQGNFLQELVGTLTDIGVEPEMAMPEYGPGQFEVTNAPAIGVAAADRAVKFREVVRSVAHARGERATFSPVMGVGKVGNGVHVHFSLQSTDGEPASFDASGRYNMSAPLGRFVAGILKHMPAILPLTAASAISYERLQPHRWSASYNNLSVQDREAGLRICPLSGDNPEKSFNVEYRAADASANPYLVLGALVWCGLDGMRNALPLPEATESDPDALDATEIAARGLQRLPTSLNAAIEAMEASEAILSFMGQEFRDAYLMNKRSELKLLEGLDLDQQVAKYVACF